MKAQKPLQNSSDKKKITHILQCRYASQKGVFVFTVVLTKVCKVFSVPTLCLPRKTFAVAPWPKMSDKSHR